MNLSSIKNFLSGKKEVEIPDLVYSPQADISDYEIGQVLKVIIASTKDYGKRYVYSVWAGLPDCAKRHFHPQERWYK